MENQLNKSILITGCSTGIGAALVSEFLEKGFLVFGSIRDKKMEAPLKKKYGRNFIPLVFDVTNYVQISKAYEKVESILKGTNLGILVNNAGIAQLGPVEHISSQEDLAFMDISSFFFQISRFFKVYFINLRPKNFGVISTSTNTSNPLLSFLWVRLE